MIVQNENIFFGLTKADQRKYSVALLRYLRAEHENFVNPCCGMFTFVRCAIEAGFEKDKIKTSDISLYTSLLGYLFSGKPIEKLGFILGDKFVDDYDKQKDEIGRVAYLMWVMKVSQIEPVAYRRDALADLYASKDVYIASLRSQIEREFAIYEGIDYEVRDLRDELSAQRTADTVMILNPPIYVGDYAKMFDFRENLQWEADIEQFDFKAEYHNLFEESKNQNYPIIWFRHEDIKGFKPEDVIFSKEYKVGEEDYALINHPELLDKFPYRKYVASFKRNNLRPYPAKMLNDDDVITENSTVQFVVVEEDIALYYRDLLAHRLGNSRAENYYLVLIDGKIMSAVGINTGHLFKLQGDYIYEQFGMSVPLKNYNTSRLLMYLLTSKSMVKAIHDTASKVNRLYTLTGIKTTNLSKYRKLKTHSGLMKTVNREKMPNGMYKIQDYTKFHDRDWNESIRLFLEDKKVK